MFVLRILRNFAALSILIVTILASTPRVVGASYCATTCNPRYGPGWCPAGCKCYGASTRGVCLRF